MWNTGHSEDGRSMEGITMDNFDNTLNSGWGCPSAILIALADFIAAHTADPDLLVLEES